jgi:hypothetical protein
VTTQIEGSHQHARTGKLYTYKAGYSVRGNDIAWQADVQRAEGAQFHRSGTIPTGTPAAGAIAEQVVRDAVVAAIDAADDGSHAL